MSDIHLEGEKADILADIVIDGYDAYAVRAINRGERSLAIAALRLAIEIDAAIAVRPCCNTTVAEHAPVRERPILSAVAFAEQCGLPFSRKAYGAPSTRCTRPRGHDGNHRK